MPNTTTSDLRARGSRGTRVAPFGAGLEQGKVYRRDELGGVALLRSMLDGGELMSVGSGLYACPKASRFGNVPPTESALISALLRGEPFVVTGPEKWNALGLGTTAVFARALVYNRKRTEVVKLGSRTFDLREVRFPEEPTEEWYALDLLEHASSMGASATELAAVLRRKVERGRFGRAALLSASKYVSLETRKLAESMAVPALASVPA